MRAMHNAYYERDKINFEGFNMQLHSSIDLIKIVITLHNTYYERDKINVLICNCIVTPSHD